MKEEMRKMMSEWGKKGGKARMRSLTPERRSEIAKKAVDAREAKKKSK